VELKSSEEVEGFVEGSGKETELVFAPWVVTGEHCRLAWELQRIFTLAYAVARAHGRPVFP